MTQREVWCGRLQDLKTDTDWLECVFRIVCTCYNFFSAACKTCTGWSKLPLGAYGLKTIFPKNRHVIIHERYNKFIYMYGIYAIIKWYLTAGKISFSLSFFKWNDFNCISELMLPTLIQRYDQNHFIFYPNQKRETNGNFTGCQMPHFIIVLIPFINLLKNNVYFLRNIEPLMYTYSIPRYDNVRVILKQMRQPFSYQKSCSKVNLVLTKSLRLDCDCASCMRISLKRSLGAVNF